MEKLKLFFFNHRLIILLISLTMIGGIFYLQFNNEKEEVIKEDIVVKELEEDSISDVRYIYVDIKGHVKNRGVYQVIDGTRVIDVIEIAGGLLDDADTSLINLSMKVYDEMAIMIYSKDEVKNFIKVKEEFNEKIIECQKTNEICLDKIEDNNVDDDLIDINKASLNELMGLPNIGNSKANSIIEYRKNNGDFKSIEEIKNVNGIGDALFEQIKDRIKV